MKKYLLLIILTLITLVSATNAWARFIVIEPTVISTAVSTNNTPNQVQFRVKIENKGDEDAHEIEATCDFLPGFSCTTVKAASLKPGAPFEEVITLTTPSITKGSFEGVLVVRYADQNGYQFSSVSPLGFSIGNIGRGMVTAFSEGVALRQKGNANLPLIVSNLGDAEAKVSVKVFVPLEITANPKEVEVVVPPRDQKELTVALKDLGAFPNSKYSLSIVTRSEQQGVVTSARSITTVEILPPFNVWQYVLVALGVLAVLYLLKTSFFKRSKSAA